MHALRGALDGRRRPEQILGRGRVAVHMKAWLQFGLHREVRRGAALDG